jgi:cell wall-associated NlpC family hydrolase
MSGGRNVRTYGGWLRCGSAVASLAVAVTVAAAAPAVAAHKSSAGPVTSCASLAQGATGKAVKTIQKAVGATPDGDFGPATEHAVKKWQKANDLAVTGVIDDATWTKLPADVATRACGLEVAGSGTATTCASLTKGSSGLAVVVLQTALGETADGEYGRLTAKAVKQVQRDAGLEVSGSTTVATWKALKLLGTPACSTAKTTGPHESKNAKAQARVRAKVQELVKALEQRPGTTKNRVTLQAMAFANKQLGKPYVYGGTGPKGYDCSGLQMKAYQHAGLTIPRTAATQYAGAGTLVSLDQARQGDLLFFASDVTKPSTVYHVSMYVGDGTMLEAPHTGANVRIVPLWTSDLLPKVVRPVASLELPLKSGDTGWSVTQLQEALNRHHAGLSVDGGYGSDTVAAVKAWQAAHDLKSTGVVRMTTWLTLG